MISKGRIEEIGGKKSRARDLQYLGGYCAWRSLKSRFLNASSSLSIISLSVSLCFALKTFVVEARAQTSGIKFGLMSCTGVFC